MKPTVPTDPQGSVMRLVRLLDFRKIIVPTHHFVEVLREIAYLHCDFTKVSMFLASYLTISIEIDTLVMIMCCVCLIQCQLPIFTDLFIY